MRRECVRRKERTKAIEFEGKDLAVWVGPEYERSQLKLLVLGESRYDEDFTDRKIIEWRIAGKFEGGQSRTFTNFERSILGQDHSVANARAFWNRTAFRNYNRSFFPGKPRVNLDYMTRVDLRNASCLRKVLQDLKPCYVVVWGLNNWDSIDAGSPWTPDQWIPGTREPFCSTTIEGHTTLFTRVHHPAAGFSSHRWAPALSGFLRLGTAKAMGA